MCSIALLPIPTQTCKNELVVFFYTTGKNDWRTVVLMHTSEDQKVFIGNKNRVV